MALDCAEIAHVLRKGGAALEDAAHDLETIRSDISRGLVNLVRPKFRP
jgi:hypothetical protein